MTHLKIGDKAPEFKGEDQFGNIISLSDLKGKKVVLYFYPKDNTPGCTAQACSLRDGNTVLLENGFTVIGISKDSLNSHKKFAEKHSLQFSLLSDPEIKIMKDYGVWGEKKFMGRTYDGTFRTTFIISEDGIIENIIEKVKTKDHTDQILKLYNLGGL